MCGEIRARACGSTRIYGAPRPPAVRKSVREGVRPDRPQRPRSLIVKGLPLPRAFRTPFGNRPEIKRYGCNTRPASPPSRQPQAVLVGARARGCFTCLGFLGRFYAEHPLCERDGGRQVIGTPTMGCAFWEREPGADDD